MWTKEERNAYMKKYRAEHREEINAYQRRYYQNCSEEQYKKHLERHKRYYHKHKDDPEFKKIRCENVKKWQKSHREHIRAYQRDRYKKKAVEKWAERSGA